MQSPPPAVRPGPCSQEPSLSRHPPSYRFAGHRSGVRGDRVLLEVVITVPDSYADVVERLCGEFDGRVPLQRVTQIVRQCCREARGSDSPADSNPPGLEGLARQRLLAVSTGERTDSEGEVS